MAPAITTNNAALRASASAGQSNSDIVISMARLSSGKRINSASDDAAGVAIASRLTAYIRGTDQAIRNALDGQALIDTAEGAYTEIKNILHKMREVSLQSANDINIDQDRANLQAEMDALSAEIDRISKTTPWGRDNLQDGSFQGKMLQIGTDVGHTNQLEITILASGANDLLVASAVTHATEHTEHTTENSLCAPTAGVDFKIGGGISPTTGVNTIMITEPSTDNDPTNTGNIWADQVLPLSNGNFVVPVVLNNSVNHALQVFDALGNPVTEKSQ